MIFGICGKIASGKSEAMKVFKSKGFYCIDADKIVHDLYLAGGEGAKRIAAVFGNEFLNDVGSVDRRKLRSEVFSDLNKLKLLNNVIHPVVYEKISELLANTAKEKIAIEAVYFDENFLGDLVDKVVWIDRPKGEIINTLINERGFTQEIAENIYSFVELPLRVDFFVRNDGALENMTKEIEKSIKA